MISEANEYRRALNKWFRKNGRELPWRSEATPYRVLVSEFMLQQTTVAAVKPFFERWMAEFPNVMSLAAAPEARVMKLWEGLGYYSRARNLHRAAQAIVERHGGEVPSDPDALRALPGVGPYTAAAVRAFAFDRPVAVLDANIQRVIARLINLTEAVDTASARNVLEEAATSLLPKTGGATHAAALMDLGATICRAGVPDCERCPLRKFCRALEPAKIPVKRPKADVIDESDVRALAVSRGRLFLVESRGPRWKGLWTLPPIERSGMAVVEFDYVVTRHRIHLEVYASRPRRDWTPFPVSALPAMPSPHGKAVALALGKSGLLL